MSSEQSPLSALQTHHLEEVPQVTHTAGETKTVFDIASELEKQLNDLLVRVEESDLEIKGKLDSIQHRLNALESKFKL
ncbi:hypothetical protein BABINDRAFT_162889, partial [Babjeviella inositovora NRRL Y-12698]